MIPMNEILIILAFIIAGLVWTIFGYISNWRKHKDDADWYGFDKRKLRDDILLGLALGVGAYLLGTYQGELIEITSLQMFIGAVIANFGIVAAVDKLIIGGIAGR